MCDDQNEENNTDEKLEENKLKELQMNKNGLYQEKDNIEENIGSENSNDLAITNATKTILTSICTVFCLFFDNSYKNDYHVSLEKVMELKKYKPGEQAVSF